MTRPFRVSALVLLLASPTMPGAMQTAALAQSDPRLGYQAPPPQPPVQAPVWQREAAQDLLRYVGRVGADGLDPAAYAPDRLSAAIEAGDEAALTAAASQTFLRLTADLSGGRVRGNGRIDWHMTDSAIDGNQQQRLMAQVMRGGDVAAALDSLLPTHPQYVGLKRALAATPAEETARRDLILTNMERWRWMPRTLGARHILVNVPAFTAAIIDNGQVVTRHRTVVGARRTPTPQLNATVTAVTFNPWWHVPQSIIRENGGRFGPGYEVRREGAAITVRQPPGPRNALGRLKIEMQNDHAIYLHDTPTQALFARPVRAFSHGCIRTQNVRDFAALLLAPTGRWSRSEIDGAIATGQTQQAALAAPIPVYIAYFTAAATSDGDVVTYPDIYGRDAPVRQALARTGGARIQQASTRD